MHQVATDDAACGMSVGSLFVLCSKGGSASSYATAGIALGVTGVLKPPHHDKMEAPRSVVKQKGMCL